MKENSREDTRHKSNPAKNQMTNFMKIRNVNVPVANEIIGEYQYGFRRNRSTVDHIFSIRKILENKWEDNKDVCQLSIDLEKAYDSIKR